MGAAAYSDSFRIAEQPPVKCTAYAPAYAKYPNPYPNLNPALPFRNTHTVTQKDTRAIYLF